MLSSTILIFLLASLLPNTIIATDYILVKSYCWLGDFDASSTYNNTLQTLLTSLASNATQSNGYDFIAQNTTMTLDNNNDGVTSTIYGMFLCRGDMNSTGSDSCAACVATATAHMPPKECPTDKSACIWYDKCMVRYSNESFQGIVDEKTFEFWKNDHDISSNKVTSFNELVGKTVQELADDQKNLKNPQELGAMKYYGTKVTKFDDFVELYTMVQCTPDLAPIDCGRCLSLAIQEIPQYCNASQGCRILNPSCYTRYEVYPFYNVVDSPPPAQSPAPAPPPLPGTLPLPPASKKKKSQSHAIIIIVLGILVLLLVALVSLLIYIKFGRRRINGNVNNIEINGRARNNAPIFENVGEDFMTTESLQYDLAILEDATNKFSDDNKLGEGGFGSVYKGTLPNGLEIAVKRLSKHSYDGIEQFKTEVEFVAKLQHRNLVQLLGYCVAADEKLLVYEFVPRKSLDLILFDPDMKEQLNWPTRYKIIQGIARGLLYLHEDSRYKIIHRDLKTGNVLLDANMNPKISDFGLARNFEVNQEHDITSRATGTPGYMAPEYLEYGEISTKSDVYSFGVLVLEIISGKKISNRQIGQDQNLLTHAWKLYNKSTPLAFVDASLGDSFSSNEVLRCMHLGLLCVQASIEDRPSMFQIVSSLNSSHALQAPQSPPSISISSSANGSRSRTKTTSSSRANDDFKSDKSTSRSSQ